MRCGGRPMPRIRVFESGTTRPVLLGQGKQDQPHETTTAGHDYEYELPPTTNPWAFHFQIEAVETAICAAGKIGAAEIGLRTTVNHWFFEAIR